MEIDNSITEQIIKKHTSMLENLLQEAFLEHFGFPLKDVQDKEELERITIEGDPIVSFRYRGETFLYVQEGGLEYGIDKKGDGFEVTIETKYKNV